MLRWPSMGRFTLLLAALATLAVGSVAAAQERPSRDTVRTMLSGFEDSPSAETWAALGPRTVDVLALLHDDPSEPSFIRNRALWAARYFPTDASRELLERALREDEGLALRVALMSLAAAFGEEEVAHITPFLAHDDVVVREGAIRALEVVHVPAATTALRARIALEPDASLVTLLRAVVAR